MGLDMFLNSRTRRNDWTKEDYEALSYCLTNLKRNQKNSTETDTPGLEFHDDYERYCYGKTKEQIKELFEIAKRDNMIYLRGDPKIYAYYSLNNEEAYWRKANSIHNWFVQEVQNGDDNCGSYEITKNHIIKLLEVCNSATFIYKQCEKEFVSDLKKYNPESYEKYKFIVDKIKENSKKKWADEYKFSDEENKFYNNICDIRKTFFEELDETLPTTAGFFFGSTDYNFWWLKDVKYTIKVCKKLIDTFDWDNKVLFYHGSW